LRAADREGRALLSDHGSFVLINIYVPFGGENDERVPEKLRFLRLVQLRCDALQRAGREVIIVGSSEMYTLSARCPYHLNLNHAFNR
jgi:AP endonuclease-2